MGDTVRKHSPNDSYPTPTSTLQESTERILASHVPINTTEANHELKKNTHVQFIARAMLQGLPSKYISQDASQPWLMFWILESFSILQVGLDPGNKQRAIDTVLACQHPDGGFGGGPAQSAHLLPTYAAVCALAIAGRPGPGGGWDDIDRDKMYKWFLSLKQPDGSFLVSHDAEVDVRGLYCLLVTATLLNLLTPELLESVPEFIAACQSYEGGFSSASLPYFGGTDTSRFPTSCLGEAHGGYTFSCLASWVLVQPYLAALRESGESEKASVRINFKSLLRWMVNMQGGGLDLGGFKGRTNKLVDGCYAWWVGGCFPLLESLGIAVEPATDAAQSLNSEEGWHDADDSLYSRQGLQEYLLWASQHPSGGLRDKPPKHPDAYHTCYCLSGLSSAQHRTIVSEGRRRSIVALWESGDEFTDLLRKNAFSSALAWVEEDGGSKVVGLNANRVNATHPVFNLTNTHAEGMMVHFYGQKVPPRTKTNI
ncbi:terpenoid cyclases/protein prenyltransferase alpha-alpha toroid [Thelephora terrestris]|uniref:Protein farnesyltransferase subunit beta n=1 Tax=Thelephora terrestris TaxID=56493 RepID=A0A9P6L8T4_9AGAM|nr:terpenoid cyclases/protein prenyltransferase alpha-alpha toroid [Thelephora terrestris]